MAQSEAVFITEVTDEEWPQCEMHREEANHPYYLSSCSVPGIHSTFHRISFSLRAEFAQLNIHRHQNVAFLFALCRFTRVVEFQTSHGVSL